MAEGFIPRYKLGVAISMHGLTDELHRQALIDFAKTGAPPESPLALMAKRATPSVPLLEASTRLDPAEIELSLRGCEASFSDDVMPEDFTPQAPREFYTERCLPRLTEQKPWQDQRLEFECACQERMRNDFWFLPYNTCLQGSCTGLKRPRPSRPESLNDFAAEVHAANQHWWHDPATGEKLDRNMGEMLMLVVSEIAECLEGERKDLMDDHLPHRKMAEVELADAVIRIADIAGANGFDLDAPFEATMDLVDNKGECLLGISTLITLFDYEGDTDRLAEAVGLIEMYAEKHGYDLWGAVAEKREYNKTRADHKPEARLAANGKKF